MALDESKYQQRQQRQPNGIEERNRDVGLLDEGAGDVGRERDQAARHIRSRNRQSADERAFWIRFLQAKFEAHHEVNPLLRVLRQSLDDGSAFIGAQTVRLKNLRHLAFLFVGNLDHFKLLARALFSVMFSVALCREITAQAHRDRAGSNLGQARGHDNSGSCSCQASQSRGERKRNSQTVRHPNNDVAHGVAGSKVSLSVPSLRHDVPYGLQNLPIKTSTPIMMKATPAPRLIQSS